MGPAFRIQSGWGWAAFILPQLEQAALYNQLDFNIGNAQGSNRSLIANPLAAFRCPSDSAPTTIATTLSDGAAARLAHGNYPGSTAVFGELSTVRFADVSDGLSQTLMVGEMTYSRSSTAELTSAWCGVVSDGLAYQFNASLPYLSITAGTPVNASRSFNSPHVGGTHFLLGDGSVHFLGESTDIHLYHALSTVNGNESVDSPF